VAVVAARDARDEERQILERVELLRLEPSGVDDGHGGADLLQRLLAALSGDDHFLDLRGGGGSVACGGDGCPYEGTARRRMQGLHGDVLRSFESPMGARLSIRCTTEG